MLSVEFGKIYRIFLISSVSELFGNSTRINFFRVVSSVQVDRSIFFGVQVDVAIVDWVERSIFFGVQGDLSIIFDVHVNLFIVSIINQVDCAMVFRIQVDLSRVFDA